MSEKRQVKKILAFQGWAKMVSWLQSDWIPHGVNLQKHPRTPPSSSGIPKYHPDQLKHPSRHPKKETQTDTNRHCQMSSNTPRQPSEPPFWPNPKRQEFFHLPFLRHQNIKTSLYAIFLNFHACQRKITIYSLFWSPCSSTQFCNVLMRNCTTTTHIIIIIIHIMISFISKLSILGQNMEYWPFKFLNKGMKMDWPPPLPPGCESLS